MRKRWVPSFRFLPSSLAAAALLFPGCSDPTTGEVTGTVTVDGVPAETGSIAFFPVDGMSSTEGAVIKAGRYEAVVPLGTARIEIRVSKKVGEKRLYDTPNSPVQPITQEILPAKYNEESELLLEIKPGTNEKDYDLTTK